MPAEENKRYDKTSVNMTDLDPKSEGFYTEILIENNTNEDISLIDRFGNETVIPSVRSVYQNPSVVITTREGNGPRVDRKNQSKPLPGEKIVIPYRQLERDHVFVEELDQIVTCTRKSEFSSHPVNVSTDEEDFREVLEDLTSRDKLFTMRIIAVDPDGTYDKVHLHMLGMSYEIPVYHFPADDSYVRICIKSPDDSSEKTIRFSMDEITENNGYISFDSGDTFHISTRPDELRNGLEEVKRAGEITSERIENIIQRKKDEFESEKQRLQQEHKTAIEDYKQRLSQKDNKIQSLSDDLEKNKKLVQQYESAMNHQQMQFKTEQEQAKTRKAELGISSELIKNSVTVLSLIVTIVTMVHSAKNSGGGS